MKKAVKTICALLLFIGIEYSCPVLMAFLAAMPCAKADDIIEGYNFSDTNTVARLCQMSAKEVDALPVAVRRHFFVYINELTAKKNHTHKAGKNLKIDASKVAPEAYKREREAFAAWRKAKSELAKAIAAASTNATATATK